MILFPSSLYFPQRSVAQRIQIRHSNFICDRLSKYQTGDMYCWRECKFSSPSGRRVSTASGENPKEKKYNSGRDMCSSRKAISRVGISLLYKTFFLFLYIRCRPSTLSRLHMFTYDTPTSSGRGCALRGCDRPLPLYLGPELDIHRIGIDMKMAKAFYKRLFIMLSALFREIDASGPRF